MSPRSPLSPKPPRLVLLAGTALVLAIGLPLALAIRTADGWTAWRVRSLGTDPDPPSH